MPRAVAPPACCCCCIDEAISGCVPWSLTPVFVLTIPLCHPARSVSQPPDLLTSCKSYRGQYCSGRQQNRRYRLLGTVRLTTGPTAPPWCFGTTCPHISARPPNATRRLKNWCSAASVVYLQPSNCGVVARKAPRYPPKTHLRRVTNQRGVPGKMSVPPAARSVSRSVTEPVGQREHTTLAPT